VRIERWPVHRLIAFAARPRGVPATVAKAGLMPHPYLTGPEPVAVGASRRWVGDPLPGCGLHQLAQHNHSLEPADQAAAPREDRASSGLSVGRDGFSVLRSPVMAAKGR
jgi:hypothetical protein